MQFGWLAIGFFCMYVYMSHRTKNNGRITLVDIPIAVLLLVSGIFSPFILILALIADVGVKNFFRNPFKKTK